MLENREEEGESFKETKIRCVNGTKSADERHKASFAKFMTSIKFNGKSGESGQRTVLFVKKVKIEHYVSKNA